MASLPLHNQLYLLRMAVASGEVFAGPVFMIVIGMVAESLSLLCKAVALLTSIFWAVIWGAVLPVEENIRDDVNSWGEKHNLLSTYIQRLFNYVTQRLFNYVTQTAHSFLVDETQPWSRFRVCTRKRHCFDGERMLWIDCSEHVMHVSISNPM